MNGMLHSLSMTLQQKSKLVHTACDNERYYKSKILFRLLLLGGFVQEFDILLGNPFLLEDSSDVLELRALNHHLAQVQLGGCTYQWSD